MQGNVQVEEDDRFESIDLLDDPLDVMVPCRPPRRRSRVGDAERARRRGVDHSRPGIALPLAFRRRIHGGGSDADRWPMSPSSGRPRRPWSGQGSGSACCRDWPASPARPTSPCPADRHGATEPEDHRRRENGQPQVASGQGIPAAPAHDVPVHPLDPPARGLLTRRRTSTALAPREEASPPSRPGSFPRMGVDRVHSRRRDCI
jgi:hypothetical protein